MAITTHLTCRHPLSRLVVLADVVDKGSGPGGADAEFAAEGVGGDRAVMVPVRYRLEISAPDFAMSVAS